MTHEEIFEKLKELLPHYSAEVIHWCVKGKFTIMVFYHNNFEFGTFTYYTEDDWLFKLYRQYQSSVFEEIIFCNLVNGKKKIIKKGMKYNV